MLCCLSYFDSFHVQHPTVLSPTPSWYFIYHSLEHLNFSQPALKYYSKYINKEKLLLQYGSLTLQKTCPGSASLFDRQYIWLITTFCVLSGSYWAQWKGYIRLIYNKKKSGKYNEPKSRSDAWQPRPVEGTFGCPETFWQTIRGPKFEAAIMWIANPYINQTIRAEKV